MLTSHDDFTSVLIRRKVLTRSQLQGAMLLQRQTNSPLWDVLIEFGYASREQVYGAMYVDADGDRVIDLSALVIPPNIIALVPEAMARENIVMPIAVVQGVLQVAMADPDDTGTLAKLTFVLDREIQPLAARRDQILDCIHRHYGGSHEESVDVLIQEFTSTADDSELSDGPEAPRTRRGELMGSDIEFELTLDESGEKKDIFETDFDIPAAGSHAAAREERDTELESSDFDLGMEDSETKTLSPPPARRTQLAMQDFARDSMDTMSYPSAGVLMEKMAAMESPAAARPVPAAKPQAARMARGLSTAMGKPMVERQATIRYYSQMAPERMFPLLVVISRKAIMQVVQRDVVQKQSKKFQVQMDSPVEIEPILPGCDCFPPKENVRISAAESSARFWVVPRVLGEVMHARVVIRQNGNVLAEVPLEMHVAKQTLTLCVGAMNFCVPFVSMLLKQSQLSLTSSEGGTGLLAAVVGWLLVMLSPEVTAGLLLLATVGLYFWLRPRQRDVFWDIRSAGATSPPTKAGGKGGAG